VKVVVSVASPPPCLFAWIVTSRDVAGDRDLRDPRGGGRGAEPGDRAGACDLREHDHVELSELTRLLPTSRISAVSVFSRPS